MEIAIIPNKELNKSAWDEFVYNSPEGSVYSLSPYLDALYPDWQAMVCTKADEWQCILPLFPKNKQFVKLNWQPVFSQYTGIMLKPIHVKHVYQHYKIKQDLITKIVDNIPHFHLFNINFHPSFDYPLPFYWAGFQLYTQYTYQIDLGNKALAFKHLRENLRRTIKKGLKQGFESETSAASHEFVQLIHSTVQGKLKLKPDSHIPVLEGIVDNLLKAGYGELKVIRDQDQRMIAGALFARFKDTTYYLFGASEEKAKKEGALSLLIWQALENAYGHFKRFDFEGSMIPSIEYFFRGFGAEPVPYLRIYKNQLPLRRLWAMFGY